jgi:hypothetical protein
MLKTDGEKKVKKDAKKDRWIAWMLVSIPLLLLLIVAIILVMLSRTGGGAAM